MLFAYLRDALASIRLPQDPNLVLRTVSLSFHGLGLSAAPKGTLGGKSLTQLWPNHRGKLGRGEALYGLFDTETGALGRN